MHVLIIGAAGMIGQKLVDAIARTGALNDHPVTTLTVADVVPPPRPAHFAGSLNRITVDLSEPKTAAQLVSARPDVIIHLAAIVSGEAEQDFEKGYRINLHGTLNLFEAIRLHAASVPEPYSPRFVFASSIAVFGAPLPDPIEDSYIRAPLTSYGTQKAMSELLLDDYTRRGILDGIALRLPTICIRPGAPNKAASGFFSGILREPLAGKPALLPVDKDVRHWHASPRAAVGFLMHAAGMDSTAIGHRRALTMPGISATVGEQIEALRRVAGNEAVALIEPKPDAEIARIVAGWPRNFDAKRAHDLGFRAETSFDEIIRIHIEDEMGGNI
ncbi:MAG: D-erythronate dehydrogenase [Pseudomonadota bacterium]